MRNHIPILLSLFRLVSASTTVFLPDDSTTLFDADLTLVHDKVIVERSGAPCTTLPTGSAPLPSPDTADAFTHLKFYTSTAKQAKTPKGYTKIFSSMFASVSLSPSE
jgi:hypothetical protein